MAREEDECDGGITGKTHNTKLVQRAYGCEARTGQDRCEACVYCHGEFLQDDFVYERRLVLTLLRSHITPSGRSRVGGDILE